jgi:hypothetical protein
VRRAIGITLGAFVVGGVAAALAREARRLEPGTAGALLLGLCIFLAFECAAHFFGSRLWGERPARLDRAAWAALSSAGIWIALLAVVPPVVRALGLSSIETAGLALLAAAAGGGLLARLWFLREIYELEFERAAAFWAVSRAAAAVLVTVGAALYALSGLLARGALPALGIVP